jgi:uncharacterized protein (TIGR04255 family)
MQGCAPRTGTEQTVRYRCGSGENSKMLNGVNLVSDPSPYPKAPITEALIDIRVTLPDETAVTDLARVDVGEEIGYPQRRNRFAVKGQIAVGDQVGTATSQRHVGYDFLSSDERQIVQIRSDGFTFSRLAPYDRWETFRAEAYRLWKLYRAVAEPVSITRVGVRYINRLDLPMPMGDLKDYLRTVPEVSPDLPQVINGYLMQLVILQEDIGALLLLNEALLPPPDPNTASVLLDIDIYRDLEASIEETELWRLLDQFRARKNQVFEACITERTRELIS